MKPLHPEALQAFARKLQLLFILRAMVQVTTLWFFLWGVLALAMRIYGAQHTE